jgi:hypothetical protein
LAIFVQLALLALVFFALWTAVRPKSAFVVQVKGGILRVKQGAVTPAFRQEVSETLRRHGVQNGVIRGTANRGRISLVFSTGIPAACRQQLRNLWTLSA